MQQDLPLVRMVNINKKFGAVEALNNVSIEVRQREVLGLLGDNGAGKSTLIKILAGVFPPDGGEIYFNEEPLKFSCPKDARAKGIETVHQELSLVDMMTISRNFFLGREPTKGIGSIALLDKKKMDKECRRVIAEIGIRVRSPNEYVSILSGGERQAISIGRAMYFGAKLLILDEPMNALSVKETRIVIGHIEKARELGTSIIFITHNVYHVYPVADRFVILDKGLKIGEFDKKEVEPEDIIEMIASGRVKTVTSLEE